MDNIDVYVMMIVTCGCFVKSRVDNESGVRQLVHNTHVHYRPVLVDTHSRLYRPTKPRAAVSRSVRDTKLCTNYN